MAAFTHLNSFNLTLVLCLIATSDLPPGAYCTNQISLAYSTHTALPLNGTYTLKVGISNISSSNLFPPSSGLSSTSVLPASTDDPSKSHLPVKDSKIAYSDVPSPFTSNEDTSLSSTRSSSLGKNIDNLDGRGSSSSLSGEDKDELSPVEQKILPVMSGNEIVLRPSPSSSPSFTSNPSLESSLFPERNEGNPFPVAYLMGVLYALASPPVLKSQAKEISSGRSGYSGGRHSNDIIRRRGRRHSAANTNDDGDEVSMTLQTYGNGGAEDGVDGGNETATSSNNNNNEEEISFDVTTPSSSSPSPSVPQAAAIMSEGTTTSTSTIPPLELTSPSEGGGVGNDSGGGNPNELFSTSTTPEPGTTRLRGKCNETAQCFGEHVECRLSICKCELGYLPRVDNGDLCGEASAHHVEIPTTDPTMIGVVVGLALMSVTLCIVLRLFAKARFRENRTIFNTPNPRLMNVSLLKGKKTLLRGNSAGQRSRRGSQASVASAQEGQPSVNTAPDGNGASAPGAGSSSHPHRVKPSRTLSTDTTNHEGTPTAGRPHRGKYRQDSVASASNV